ESVAARPALWVGQARVASAADLDRLPVPSHVGEALRSGEARAVMRAEHRPSVPGTLVGAVPGVVVRVVDAGRVSKQAVRVLGVHERTVGGAEVVRGGFLAQDGE